MCCLLLIFALAMHGDNIIRAMECGHRRKKFMLAASSVAGSHGLLVCTGRPGARKMHLQCLVRKEKKRKIFARACVCAKGRNSKDSRREKKKNLHLSVFTGRLGFDVRNRLRKYLLRTHPQSSPPRCRPVREIEPECTYVLRSFSLPQS